jgi:hypothetical protein
MNDPVVTLILRREARTAEIHGWVIIALCAMCFVVVSYHTFVLDPIDDHNYRESLKVARMEGIICARTNATLRAAAGRIHSAQLETPQP